jgi:hypothetical protein
MFSAQNGIAKALSMGTSTCMLTSNDEILVEFWVHYNIGNVFSILFQRLASLGNVRGQKVIVRLVQKADKVRSARSERNLYNSCSVR